MRREETHAIPGIYGGEDLRLVGDVDEAADGHHDHPDDHDRAKPGGDLGGATALGVKEPEDDRDGDRQNIGIELRRDQLHAFHRREHGDGGRDHGVAEKQGGAAHAQQEDRLRLPPDGALREGHQRQGAAFALVVGAQQHKHIFEAHDDRERPQDERKDAKDIVPLDTPLAATRGQNGFAQSVERTGADIAVDDADRADEEGPEC